mmetsp:Transcript_966/g.1728  ORF Transcript_966/g.1728 Transcript_966/m.1728 type:complete len:97 (+) Transcript_966:1046-1336(+)
MNIDQFNKSFYHRPGIRAQLIDTQKRMLINDFLIRRQNIDLVGVSGVDESESKAADVVHLLNISSPGWTSAFPFANKIISELMGEDEEKLLREDNI